MKMKQFVRLMIIACVALLVTGKAMAAPDNVIIAEDDTIVNLNYANIPSNGTYMGVVYSKIPLSVPEIYVSTVETYLKFDLSSLTTDISPASNLRLSVAAPSPTGITIELLGYDENTWSETTLDWNTAKSSQNQLKIVSLGTYTNSIEGIYHGDVEYGWIKFQSIAMANYINQHRATDKKVSFILRFSGCGPCTEFDSTIFWDKENGAGGREPRLQIYGPTAVDVSDFTAQADFGRVALNWQTFNETQLSGFNVYRSDTVAGARQRLNQNMILVLHPGQALGDEYEMFDYTAHPGQTYYYWLEQVDPFGEALSRGPVVINTLRWYFLPFLRK